MVLNFKEWLKENLWGNIPVKTKKPSDGHRFGGPMLAQMKKKMKKK